MAPSATPKSRPRAPAVAGSCVAARSRVRSVVPPTIVASSSPAGQGASTSSATTTVSTKTRLVKAEKVVRRGQKFAEMGSSEADRVQLHFEIRRLGVPIDPQKLLPAR